MFADYRIPQNLHNMGCLWYSPRLESRIKIKEELRSGEISEVELRGCSIWCVELIRREILKHHPAAEINAILIDFFLYDSMKKKEEICDPVDILPHHRTRSIWY